MDRGAAMLILLGMLVSIGLVLLALFAVAPIFCSCIISLLYTLYLFITNETSGIHHAQEFENRFWTVFAIMFSTALFFARDSPLAFGRCWPGLGFFAVAAMGYGMHAWDRYAHRKEISRGHGLKRGSTGTSSLVRLEAAGQLAQVNSCLSDIDQLLIPSTINNFINQRFILRKERDIISIFEEAEPKALNYLIAHAKLGLLFYKIKDHRNFSGQHRTEFIELLAVGRISVLTVISRVIVLHALQMMKLPANARAEYWVRNIIISTHQDDLSELKTVTDAKGDYFSMTKLIYDDIRSETVRQDILTHLKKEAAIQEAHMAMGTRKSKLRKQKAWRKVLSDVDDTLTCSGGSYPAGIDKRFGKKVVYPGVLAFYRELDLGSTGPKEWPMGAAGNLVFLSARPHIYKDVSEKHNFAKFEKLIARGGADGRGGMHTVPSLLAGDISSGREYIVTNDMEPLALKKFENFKRYVSIYPEFKHVFVCDNGQGDVRAGDLMFDAFPKHLEALYVHVVQDRQKTHGYNPDAWSKKGFQPCFFTTYPEAALDAASRMPPLIRVESLRRICQDAVNDFYMIQTKEWPTQRHKANRRTELNQGIWKANQFLTSHGNDAVPLIEAERLWKDGEMVRTPYGIAKIISFDAIHDLYEVELDWRPLNVQVAEHKDRETKGKNIESGSLTSHSSSVKEGGPKVLETVMETAEEAEEDSCENGLGIDALKQPEPGIRNKFSEEVQLNGSQEVPNSPGNARNENVPLRQSTSLSEDSMKMVGSSGDANPDSIPSDNDSVGLGNVNSRLRVESPIHAENKVRDPEASQNWSHPVVAKIQGRDIKKYSPPLLPALPREGRSIFSFWESGKLKAEEFKPGDKCTTPYGPAKVAEYRKGKKVVVVDMIGWDGRAYLQKDCVKVVSEGLWESLLRRLYPAESKTTASVQQRRKPPKDLEFPYAVGSVIPTPFGEGVVSRPLPPPGGISRTVPSKLEKSEALSSIGQAQANSPKPLKGASSKQQVPTIGISLTSWVLGNESHPMLYCTYETARKWKNAKDEKTPGSSLLSVVGSLVTKGLKRMTSQVTSAPPEPKPQRFVRYYQDGASVTTSFGDGIIRSFRESDGFYEVSLVSWTMKAGMHPVAYLQKDALSYRIAKGCQEGRPVLTSLGLSGTLASVEPTTGVHVVTIPSLSMVCYLQPSEIIRPLKAAVGEDVATPYGEGIVRRYRIDDNMYEISLTGCGATLYAQGETFDRIHDGMKNHEGPFGMSWLLRYIFFTSDDVAQVGGGSRSRSNSISLSVRSQISGKST